MDSDGAISKACTQADLAETLGVSQVTVHKALKGYPGVSDRLRHRVRRLAQDRGYRLHLGARAMRQGRFGAATLVLSLAEQGRSTLSEGLLQGVSLAFEERGMHVSIAVLPDEELTNESFVPRILREWLSDGLLLNYNKNVPARLEDLVRDYRIPSIWLNYKRDHDAAYPDDYAAGKDAVRRLLAAGHRRIAYANFSYKLESVHYSDPDRCDGYVAAMREAGLSPLAIDRYTHDAADQARRTPVCAELLSLPDRPTAVIGYSTNTLEHFVRAAERLGLAIPRDLSLMTFSGDPVSVGQDVDAMRVPDVEVGRAGVEMLLEKIAAPGGTLPARAVQFGYLGGATVAPPCR